MRVSLHALAGLRTFQPRVSRSSRRSFRITGLHPSQYSGFSRSSPCGFRDSRPIPFPNTSAADGSTLGLGARACSWGDKVKKSSRSYYCGAGKTRGRGSPQGLGTSTRSLSSLHLLRDTDLGTSISLNRTSFSAYPRACWKFTYSCQSRGTGKVQGQHAGSQGPPSRRQSLLRMDFSTDN